VVAAASPASAGRNVRDGLGRNRAAFQRVAERSMERIRAVAIQELEQPLRLMADAVATLRDRSEKRVRVRPDQTQAIATAELARCTLALAERLQVLGMLDLAPAVIAARVTGDRLAAFGNTDLGLAGDQRQGLSIRSSGIL
jgi:hypothetical protein